MSEKDESEDSLTNSESEGDSEHEQVEWLAISRRKRSTAGNRMKTMLAVERPAGDDSDLELLFASDEDDAGFTDQQKDDGSDVQMDSSDDDDHEEGAGADDLEGEKELERQARERRTVQRKRKAQDAIPAKFRKKVRIQQAATGSASPSSAISALGLGRARKKSERCSWLPSTGEQPTRASERHTTKVSKEQLHQKLVVDDARRRCLEARQEKKRKEREACKKAPMTQAERLAEAARVEKRNAKSLNRWEEAEKEREEERLRKIAALHSRKLDGPVVTFWSGIQEMEEGQRKHVGKMVSMEEKVPKRKRASLVGLASQAADGRAALSPKLASPADSLAPTPGGEDSPAEMVPRSASRPPMARESFLPPCAADQQSTGTSPGCMPPPPIPAEVRRKSTGFLSAPVLISPLQMPSDGRSSILAPPQTSHASAKVALSSSLPTPAGPVQTVEVATGTAPTTRPSLAPLRTNLAGPAREVAVRRQKTAIEPAGETRVTRSCIILQNFDPVAIKDRQVQTQILFGRKMNKLARPAHAPLCVITKHVARYRDPKTGLPYCNSHAYREIQRLYRGDYKWSSLVGAWVGRGNYAALGVPKRFLDVDRKDERAGVVPTGEV